MAQNGKEEGGLFSRIGQLVGDIVYEKEETTTLDSTTQAAPVVVPSPAASDCAQPSVQAVQPSSVASVQVVDEKVYQAIKAAIDNKGGAYVQFADMASSLDMIPDEVKRYQAALVAISKQGVSLDQIVRAVDHRLAALEEESRKFEGALKEKNANLDSLNAAIAAKESEVAELQERINQLRSEQEKIAQQRGEEEKKVASVKGNFDAALAKIRGEITDEQNKIAQYLKGGV